MIDLVKEVINAMKNFMNSDLAILIEFISLISTIIFGTIWIFKKGRLHYSLLQKLGAVILIIIFGLLFPILALLTSPWSDWIRITLNSIAIYCLINFAILIHTIFHFSRRTLGQDSNEAKH